MATTRTAQYTLRRAEIEGRITTLPNGTHLHCLRWDANDNTQGDWAWHAVIAVDGPLPIGAEVGAFDEGEILRALNDLGIYIQSHGGGQAGGPFADQPWVQYLGQPIRTLLVSQRGGLDV